MCMSVDIVWKSRKESFGFDSRSRASSIFCGFFADFSRPLSCQKYFLIDAKGTLHGHPLGLRIHERFPKNVRPLEKKN